MERLVRQLAASATTLDSRPPMAQWLLQQRDGQSNELHYHRRRERRPQRLRQRGKHQRIRHHGLCRVRQAVVAGGHLRQSGGRRARHAGCFAFRRERSLGTFLRDLLVRHRQLFRRRRRPLRPTRPILLPRRRPGAVLAERRVSRSADGRHAGAGEPEMGHQGGQSQPHLLPIAKAEFGSSGNSACYSINQPPRRGLASSCVFYDITQGDINVDCRQNGTVHSLLHPFRH